MGRIFVSAVVVVLAVSGMARAQTLDVGTVTCTDVAQMPTDALVKLLFWIDGYMGGAAQDQNYDEERLQGNIDSAVSLCAESPDATLMDVLDKAENG